MTTQHYSMFTLLDASNEKSNVTIYNGAITATSLPGFLTQFGAVRSAIDAITLGTIHKEAWIGDSTVLSQTLPTNAFAQRELKWLVRYRGNTSNKIFTLTIPTADPAGRLVAGTDRADLTNPQIQTFITEFQNFARTPDDDTETVTVLDITLVGRNI
ncbi:MAG: hypothetical protein SNJ80_12550 [Anaerolinea sp.]